AAVAGEVQESLELTAHRGDVGLERLAIQESTFRGRPGRVTDHPGPAADDGDRSAAMALEVDEAEDRDEVADVQPRPGRVEAVVAGNWPTRRQPRLEALR